MTDYSELPDNTSLPFLVYGFYRPKKHILSKIKSMEVKHSDSECIIKNINPITIKHEKYNKNGYLIYFDDKYSKDAYNIISKSESSEPSKWDKIDIDGIEANVLIQENKDNYHLQPPIDTIDLPFFAYGIFKKNEIAYSKIKKYVKDKPENHIIDYEIRMRDGVPILIKEKGEFKSEGNLIYFKENNREKAYQIISKTELKDLYRWDVIKVNGHDANVLIGIDPNNGSSNIEFYGKYYSYKGIDDPFFKESILIIKKFLGEDKGPTVMNLLKLQMHYLLLWASIERYCDLKYAKSRINQNIKEFSEEEVVENSIKNLKRFKNRAYDKNDELLTVFSAEDLQDYTLKPKKPFDSLKYYYTIRCNVVHRGKISMDKDEHLLRFGLMDLCEIFENVIKDTFKNE